MTTPLPQINALVTNELIELHAEAICNATGGPQWVELQSTRQAGIMRAEARAALAVVAPLIAARAWDQGFAEGCRGRMWDSTNPYERKDEQ